LGCSSKEGQDKFTKLSEHYKRLISPKLPTCGLNWVQPQVTQLAVVHFKASAAACLAKKNVSHQE